MVIFKKNVMEDFYSWLFPILFAVEDKTAVISDKYQNRYPGFMSERLMSFFFYDRRDKYRVVYSDKTFLK